VSKHNIESAWLNWEEVVKLSQGKRIVFFGKGEWVERTMPYLSVKSGYIVDNNPYEHGERQFDLETKNPAVLKDEKWDEILVIITTSSFTEVAAQLIGYGLEVGKHFIVTPSLKNYKFIAPINSHDCTILFTCGDQPDDEDDSSGGGFYSISLQDPKPKKLISGHCHGFVKGGDKYYVVDDRVGVRVLDSKLVQIDTFTLPPKSRPHGIAYCEKRDLLFIVLTGNDTIGVYSAKNYSKVGEVVVSNKYERIGIAQHHTNDVCVFEDSVFLSMISYSGNWKKSVHDGVIVEIDIDTLQVRGVVVSGLWYPHSPTIIKGNLCYCDSMRGTIHNNTWKTLARFNGFVRGIAHDGQYYYVGQSSHRYIDRIEGTSDNISLDTGIYLIEEQSKITKFFAMPNLVDIKSILVYEDK
jgi:hypothetical protein